jgi:NitT/TauT family transport system substrate-binding protein
MKLSRKIGAIALAVILLFTISACSAGNDSSSSQSQISSAVSADDTSSSQTEKTVIRIAGLKGPTGLSMVKLMSDSEAGTASDDDQFTIVSSPDEIVAKLSSGEVDVAAAPTNLAATLYNKTDGGVQLMAVTTLGVLYVLTADGESVQSVSGFEREDYLRFPDRELRRNMLLTIFFVRMDWNPGKMLLGNIKRSTQNWLL